MCSTPASTAASTKVTVLGEPVGRLRGRDHEEGLHAVEGEQRGIPVSVGRPHGVCSRQGGRALR